MNAITHQAADVKVRYQNRLAELKAEDNNLFDTDSRPGAVRADGLQAAWVEEGDNFAFVARQGERLEFGVFTPGDEILGGNTAAGVAEKNVLASGLTSGHQSDYTEVNERALDDTQKARLGQKLGSLLDQALQGDGLVFEVIRDQQNTRYW